MDYDLAASLPAVAAQYRRNAVLIHAGHGKLDLLLPVGIERLAARINVADDRFDVCSH